MKVCALVMAAGSGRRMGGNVKKQFLKLDRREILSHTLDTFQSCSSVDSIVVVTSEDELGHVRKLASGFSKVTAVVKGGSERQYSVFNGLKALEECYLVLIHDGVRPFVREEEIFACISGADKYGGCVLGVPVKDTVKVCDREGQVVDTPDRSTLWLAQTPQAFKYDVIMDAHRRAQDEGFLGTDDASLVERYGLKIHMVQGSYENIKITTPEDLLYAKAILAGRKQADNVK